MRRTMVLLKLTNADYFEYRQWCGVNAQPLRKGMVDTRPAACGSPPHRLGDVGSTPATTVVL